jgi:hypothetical protein
MALAGCVYATAGLMSALTSGTIEAVQVPALKVLTMLPAWNFYTWAGIIWVSATLSHYWIDGVIWKLRRPELAKRVGLTDAAADAA